MDKIELQEKIEIVKKCILDYDLELLELRGKLDKILIEENKPLYSGKYYKIAKSKKNYSVFRVEEVRSRTLVGTEYVINKEDEFHIVLKKYEGTFNTITYINTCSWTETTEKEFARMEKLYNVLYNIK